MRVKATIAYDGTDYFGWQIQKNHATIQSEIESALRQISRSEIGITGAGRTDSGVHAYAQVAHFDWDHPLRPDQLQLGLNGILPADIRIRKIEEVHPDFHARFDARRKTYLYRIDRNRAFDPFLRRYALQYYSLLNMDALRECARIAVGEHDFRAFQATGTDIVSTVRQIYNVEIIEETSAPYSASSLLLIRVQANGFLRKMMRFLVGTMMEIATSKRKVEDLRKALETGERQFVGVPVAARGLFLERVDYQE